MKIYEKKITSINISHYINNNNLAILLNCESEFDGEEPFACITTNTDTILYGDNEVVLDTNNCPWVESWIEENKLGNKIGETKSGFCVYPIYEIDLKKIKELNDNL